MDDLIEQMAEKSGIDPNRLEKLLDETDAIVGGLRYREVYEIAVLGVLACRIDHETGDFPSWLLKGIVEIQSGRRDGSGSEKVS